jgi:hypothetical protein
MHLNPLRRAVAFVALGNLAYFGVEFSIALAIGSVSLFADSVNFLEDASVNLLILVALGWTVRKRARIGMLLAVILLIPGLAALWTAWEKLTSSQPPAPLPLSATGLGALAVNLACAVVLARYRHHGGSLTKAAFLSATPRRSFFSRTGLSAASTPCTWKTDLDVSTPTLITSFMDGLLQLVCNDPAWHIDAVRGPSTPTEEQQRAAPRDLPTEGVERRQQAERADQDGGGQEEELVDEAAHGPTRCSILALHLPGVGVDDQHESLPTLHQGRGEVLALLGEAFKGADALIRETRRPALSFEKIERPGRAPPLGACVL